MFAWNIEYIISISVFSYPNKAWMNVVLDQSKILVTLDFKLAHGSWWLYHSYFWKQINFSCWIFLSLLMNWLITGDCCDSNSNGSFFVKYKYQAEETFENDF